MNECREELLGGGKEGREGRKEGAITISEREMGAPSSPRVPPSLPGESMQEAAIGNLVGGA